MGVYRNKKIKKGRKEGMKSVNGNSQFLFPATKSMLAQCWILPKVSFLFQQSILTWKPEALICWKSPLQKTQWYVGNSIILHLCFSNVKWQQLSRNLLANWQTTAMKQLTGKAGAFFIMYPEEQKQWEKTQTCLLPINSPSRKLSRMWAAPIE